MTPLGLRICFHATESVSTPNLFQPTEYRASSAHICRNTPGPRPASSWGPLILEQSLEVNDIKQICRGAVVHICSILMKKFPCFFGMDDLLGSISELCPRVSELYHIVEDSSCLSSCSRKETSETLLPHLRTSPKLPSKHIK